MTTELIVKVPGKVMLCGEYLVLYGVGSTAIAFAIDSYLEVYARYGTTKRESLTLRSNLWDKERQIDANTERDEMLIDSICELMPAGEHKVEEIVVTSQLDPRHGFGSSSALYMALTTIAFLQQRATNLIIPQAKRWQLAGQAFELQKQRQGLASGYDIATQFAGGLVKYSSDGGKWPYYGGATRPLVRWGESFEGEVAHDLHDELSEIVHLFVGGRGSDTTTVIRDTDKWLSSHGHLPLVIQTRELESSFIDALRNPEKLPELIAATARWRAWFCTSPHFPLRIEMALYAVSGRDQKWSWKTSGAGGGDAIIVIGHRQDITEVIECLAEYGWHPFNYKVAERGIKFRRV